jgi:hypothetical protein
MSASVHTFMLLEKCLDAGVSMVTNPAGSLRIRTEIEKSPHEDKIPINCVGHHVKQNLDALPILIDSCRS